VTVDPRVELLALRFVEGSGDWASGTQWDDLNAKEYELACREAQDLLRLLDEQSPKPADAVEGDRPPEMLTSAEAHRLVVGVMSSDPDEDLSAQEAEWERADAKLRRIASGEAVEGDRDDAVERVASIMLSAERRRQDVGQTASDIVEALSGGGVEPSRETENEYDHGAIDSFHAGVAVGQGMAEARVVELTAEADRLHRLMAEMAKQQNAELRELRAALAAYRSALRSGESESPQLRALSDAALAAAGEGEDPRCATCRDVGAAYCDDCSSRVRPDEWQPREDRPFDPCPCGGDHLAIDHPSGSPLPEPEDH
jgi:hypothetical protein